VRVVSHYHFGQARRSLRADAYAAGGAACVAAMACIRGRDLDGARALYAQAAEHFKAAGADDKLAQCEKTIAWIDGFMTRKAG
jgi:hypothetical protein